MGTIHQYEWNWAEAAKALARYFELDPHATNYGYAYHLLSLGRPDEAIAWIQRSREHDPLSVLIAANVGEVLLYERLYDDAVLPYRRTQGSLYTRLGVVLNSVGRR